MLFPLIHIFDSHISTRATQKQLNPSPLFLDKLLEYLDKISFII